MLKLEVDRVGLDNVSGGAAGLVAAMQGTRDGFALGGMASAATGAEPGAVIGAGGAFLFGKIADAGQHASDKYVNLQTRLNDNFDRLMTNSQSPGSLAGLAGDTPGSAGGPFSFSGINLRPTAGELQDFQQSLTQSRTSTFGGSGASPSDLGLGGILFAHDNSYRVDLAGRLASEVNDDLRRGRGTSGPVMGRTRYFDNIPLLWLDVAGSRNRSLPVAMPRFLTGGDADVRTNFGGPWSFEPLTLDVRRSKHDGRKPLRATVTPAETQTGVSYMPLDLVVEDASPIWIIRNGTGFEPQLGMSEAGRFVWTLRHGVEIEFGEDGLVDAIRSPHGEHINP